VDSELRPTSSGTRGGDRGPRTHASLFIIESVNFEDEEHGRLEGEILSRMLWLSGKETDYRYIRTRQELVAVLQHFQTSGRRYLHVSCHGNEEALATTLNEIPFGELGRLLRPFLRGRRLFVSACQAVNDDLADALMRRTGCFSIVGPATDIGFDEAAVMWAAFYYLMFKKNPKAMNTRTIKAVLRQLSETFAVPMTYLQRTDTKPYWRRIELHT
jgi:hypothetical protein